MPGPLLAIDGTVRPLPLVLRPAGLDQGRRRASGQRAARRGQPDPAHRRRPPAAGDRRLLRRRGGQVPGRALSRLPRPAPAGSRRAGVAVRAGARRCSRRSAGACRSIPSWRPMTCSARWPPPRPPPAGAALIMTGDRDMYQCAAEHVSVSTSSRARAASRRSTPTRCAARYGIGPELVPDFIALRGDPSDGLPGRPGIGAKTAAVAAAAPRLARGRDRRRRPGAPARRRGADRQRR